ncbi:MAG: trypsin-like serine protease [Myxococcota bacterium]
MLAIAILWASGTAHGQFSSIVNGVQELAEPSTGALLVGDADSGKVTCTVSLVGCDAAITTAHCFNSSPETKTWVYFQHAGFVEIESATRHPAYAEALATFPPDVFDILRIEDIAFIKFVRPVSGITPAKLVNTLPALATPGTKVGFGRDPLTQQSAGSGDWNVGIKRSGTMELAACIGDLDGEDVLCWQPPVSQGAPGEDVSTCEGDSGGPMFVDESGTRVVAGLTKGKFIDSQGQSDLCVPPVHPYDTNVHRHRDWIDGSSGVGGMVLDTGAIALDIQQCGTLPQLDDASPSGDAMGDCIADPWGETEEVRTCGFSGFLFEATSAAHSFAVPDGTSELRVAFNGVAGGLPVVDTNYYLRAGSPASASDFDCKADGGGNLGYCVYNNLPTSGTWHVAVDQDLYQGEYQVTVTLFHPILQVPALEGTGRLALAFALVAVMAVRSSRMRGLARS